MSEQSVLKLLETVVQGGSIQTDSDNIAVVITRTDNNEDLTKRLTIQVTQNGVTRSQLVKKNAAGEVIAITALE
jgi:hypothetical protein